MIITIDGPCASGKSTLARNIANKLGIYYLNTGFLYRSVAYILVVKFGYDQEKLKEPDQHDLEYIFDNSRLIYFYDGDVYISFNGQDITEFLKTSEVDNISSIVSTNQRVRKMLLEYQRAVGENTNLVVDGRDTGSVVFPNADLKIFLTASVEVRAVRWQHDMELKGQCYTLQESIAIISERDKRDKERKISPLIIPEGAVIIDSSNLSQDEVLKKIISIIN